MIFSKATMAPVLALVTQLVLAGNPSQLKADPPVKDSEKKPVSDPLLETARKAAIAYATKKNFPAAQLDMLKKPPLTVRDFTDKDSNKMKNYQWLGTGKGGWYLFVIVDPATGKVVSVAGGHETC